MPRQRAGPLQAPAAPRAPRKAWHQGPAFSPALVAGLRCPSSRRAERVRSRSTARHVARADAARVLATCAVPARHLRRAASVRRSSDRAPSSSVAIDQLWGGDKSARGPFGKLVEADPKVEVRGGDLENATVWIIRARSARLRARARSSRPRNLAATDSLRERPHEGTVLIASTALTRRADRQPGQRRADAARRMLGRVPCRARSRFGP
jgi:hypothetical protein